MDSHIHIWESETASRPRARKANSSIPDPHTSEMMVRVLDDHQVEGAGAVTHTMMGFDNRYVVESARRHAGRFVVFGRFDMTAPHVNRRMAEWLSKPFTAGIRLTYFNTPEEPQFDSRLLDRFWSAAEIQCVPVAVYAPAGMQELLTVLERYPGLNLILDHLGLGVSPGIADSNAGFQLMDKFSAHRNVRVKVSAAYRLSSEPFPFNDVHPYIRRVLELFGARRMMWGSDYPNTLHYCSYIEAVRYITDGCDFISEEEMRWIMGDTFREVVRLALRPARSATWLARFAESP